MWGTRAALAFVVLVTGGLVASPVGQVAAATPPVVINELNYNPTDGNPAGEWLELLNTTGAAIDLSGWCIGGVSYCFAAGATIAPGGFVLVGGSEYTGALSNSGEKITLQDAAKVTVDAVTYEDDGVWPAMADGDGHSLQRRDPNSSSTKPGNWVSAPQTPWAHNNGAGAGLLPSFSNVVHTVLPAAGQAIDVSAKLADATAATLVYRVGVPGSEMAVAMTVTGGVATASIPGQAAGALVRYRLEATTDGRTGTWPRQGDGSTYTGTTVARPSPSGLPVFEFFMDDATYNLMVNDLDLTGDNGYGMTFAYKGQVFDLARIRVKGQVSRSFPKKKFKIILPAGHVLDDDIFPDAVDEFAVHSSWSDRSFLRETLASEFMTAADALGAQQALPIRLERNGAFYGLYTYVEQPDGTWRDRYLLDDSEVYEVGPDNIFGLLAPADITRSQATLRARYDKETFDYLNDDVLREFINVVNGLSGAAEREWMLANANVPSIVNALATSMVIQHQDWGHKNYRLVFDQHGLVGVTQNDYDLSFGRRWSQTAGPTSTDVGIGGAFEHPGGPFFETFFFDPVLSEMIKRRIRTLAEEVLVPANLSARVDTLAAQVRPDAVADRARWGTYGGSADPTVEARRIIDQFVSPQQSRLLGTMAAQNRVARTSQPAVPNVTFSGAQYDGVEFVTVTNHSGDSVDLSGFTIPELEFTVPGGTVLLPGRAAVFNHEDAGRIAGGFPGMLLAGTFPESLMDAPDGITLRNRSGAIVATWNPLIPGTVTELDGQANRSALVSIVATGTLAPGYLQVHDCATEPGATSNLNVDGSGQTRAVLALAKFDADGKACLFNLNATHAVADLQGYFADGAVDDIVDARLIDTRSGAKPLSSSLTKITGGRPSSTGLVSLVATQTDGPGYLAVVDCSSTGEPPTSNLNFDRAGQTVATLTFARFDAQGEVCVWALTGTHIVADVQGYLAPTAFDDIADERLIDTRSGAQPVPSVVTLHGRPNSTGVVSLVATAATAPLYLQVLPCGSTPGATSNINVDRQGATANGLATVQFAADGTACVFASSVTQIVADLQGYFTAGAFDDIADTRLLDSR